MAAQKYAPRPRQSFHPRLRVCDAYTYGSWHVQLAPRTLTIGDRRQCVTFAIHDVRTTLLVNSTMYVYIAVAERLVCDASFTRRGRTRRGTEEWDGQARQEDATTGSEETVKREGVGKYVHRQKGK